MFILLYILTGTIRKTLKICSLIIFLVVVISSIVVYRDIRTLIDLPTAQTKWILFEEKTIYNVMIIEKGNISGVNEEIITTYNEWYGNKLMNKIRNGSKKVIFIEKTLINGLENNVEVGDGVYMTKDQMKNILEKGSQEEKNAVFQVLIMDVFGMRKKGKIEIFFNNIKEEKIQFYPKIYSLNVLAKTPSLINLVLPSDDN